MTLFFTPNVRHITNDLIAKYELEEISAEHVDPNEVIMMATDDTISIGKTELDTGFKDSYRYEHIILEALPIITRIYEATDSGTWDGFQMIPTVNINAANARFFQ